MLNTNQNMRQQFQLSEDVDFTGNDIVEVAYADGEGLRHDRYGRLMSSKGLVSNFDSKSITFVGGYESPRPFFYLDTTRRSGGTHRMAMVIRRIGTYNGYDQNHFDTPKEWIHTENGR